ncbi:MAG: D-alanine--D-alanine ligase [Ignavibacteriae bacterium]|nr:MAG: D-alanine--D-alanine ligase [Ignavibacteriota bacterium]
MRVIVLTGGVSSERNVSIASSRAIAKGLKESGHEVIVVDPIYGAIQPPEEDILNVRPVIGKEFPTAEELMAYSNRKVIECVSSDLFDNIDIVFLGLHGKFGEDGKIQSLLEMRGVKYTGSGVTSSAMAMDKNISKVMFNHFGVPTPNWFMVEKGNYSFNHVDEKVNAYIDYPAVVKPNDEGSTVGLSIVQPDVEDMQLTSALELAFKYTDSVMIEQFIPGRELTVAILGDEPLPIVEIKPNDGFYDYEHKYTSGRTEYFCPAEMHEDLCQKIQNNALVAHRALQCKAYSRVDYRLNDNNEFYCLEVNTLPGMTELSLVPKAAKARGIGFSELLNKIIELSI